MKTTKTKDLILISLFAALTAMGAYISIPIGIVPITLQSLFCLLAAMLLGSKRAALSQLLYIFIGLAGLPVFSGGKGGLTFILSPTFGFVLGFIICALMVGYISEKNNASFINFFTASILGTLVIYAFGIFLFYFNMKYLSFKDMTFKAILTVTTLPFIPGDLIKCFAASLAAVPVYKSAKKLNYI
ncbi:biotin transporter BioY [Clostridium polynesiense]|uniref:biotin transporter BioY n=1 Tax=Clostridium polynesiense TaxID=1325933 RepID=UPI000590A4CB|nr:biotin transporter BioY [Clostridium polynesiense]